MFEQKSKAELYKADSNSLHLEAMRAAKLHLTSEAYLLTVIEVVDDRRIFEDCDLTSLYQYCTLLLNLSEAISYSLIAVVRKGREVVELKEAVLSGKVTLSKAKKICSIITKQNHKEWIDLAANQTSRIIEKCVAQANPKEPTKESLKYVSENRLEFKLGISEEFLELLGSAKDLLSQKQMKAVSSEEALLVALKELIEKHDPVRKAERAVKRANAKNERNYQGKSELVPGTVTKAATELKPDHKAVKLKLGPGKRKPISRKPIKRLTMHLVKLRDQNQCTHASPRGRCQQKRWLDTHHIVPVAQGGNDEITNLTTLCSAHHRRQHGH